MGFYRLAVFASIMASVLVLSSCGNRANKKSKLIDDSQKEVLKENVTQKIDSLAACISKLGNIPLYDKIEDGSFALSEKEKMVKPKYLLRLSTVTDLVTWRQKYRAVMMYNIDMQVAKLYGMSVKGFQKALYKLYVDIDSPVLLELCSEKGDTLARNDKSIEQIFSDAYEEEAKNKTLNLYWEAMAGGLVETVFILSQNTDTFISSFDDKDVCELSDRLALTSQAIGELMEYYPEMTEINKAIVPLAKITARDVRTLTRQLDNLKPEISSIRNSLLTE